MEEFKIVNIVEQILEIRAIRELLADIREKLQDRRIFRREYLSKLDDIISCLGNISSNTEQKL